MAERLFELQQQHQLFLFNVIHFNVVWPETFNDDNNVVLFDKVVNPDTFNDENNVVSFTNWDFPLMFNTDDEVY